MLPLIFFFGLLASATAEESPTLEVVEVQVGEFYRERVLGLELDLINRGPKARKVRVQADLAQGDEILARTDDALEIPPNQRRGARLTHKNNFGKYRIQYRIMDDASGQALAKNALDFESGGPLQVDLLPFFLSRNGVLAKCRLDVPPDHRTFQWSGRMLSENGETRSQASRTAENLEAELLLEARMLPSGKYRALIEVGDAQGVIFGRRTIPFIRPEDPPWWAHREGFEPAVPEPWTPVELSGDDGRFEARVWGRRYVFEGSPLPAYIENQGKPILAGPIRLAPGNEGGTDLDAFGPWRPDQTTRDDEAVTLSYRGSAAGFEVRAATRIEFDGFMRIDLVLEPKPGQPTTVGPFGLLVPVQADLATHMTNYRTAPGPATAVGRYVGPVPAPGRDYRSPVMLTTWLGCDTGGLEWSAESSRGWSLENPQEALRVWRQDPAVWFEARLASRPFRLQQRRTWTFGLVATPTKPLPKGWAQWRIYDNINPMIVPYDWSGYSMWNPEVTDPALKQKLQEMYRGIRERGGKPLVHGGWGVSSVAPEWPTWCLEMIAEPVTPTIYDEYDGCYRTPYVDFMAGSFAANARNLGFDGIRFDTVIPWRPCESEVHGCGWRGDDGRLFGSANLWAQREFLKRMYRVFHGGAIPDGLIYLPVAGPPLMCIESFEDIHETGEGYYMKAASLREGYPQEAVRVWMTGRPYGFIAQNNIKGEPLGSNQRIGALLAAGAEPRFVPWQNSSINYERTSIPAPAIWSVYAWIDRSTAEWHPHWENDALISHEPRDREIYTSFYLQKGRRMLLIVTSYETEPVDEVRITLDIEKLGLPAALHADDAITQERLEASSGRISLAILPERYRLVRVSTEPFTEEKPLALTQPRSEAATARATPPPDWSSLKLGPNLLSNGGFEAWTGPQEDEEDEDEDEADRGEDGEDKEDKEEREGKDDGKRAGDVDQEAEPEGSEKMKKWGQQWTAGALSPEGWMPFSYNPRVNQAFRDESVRIEGRCSLRVETANDFFAMQGKAVKAHTRYALRALVRVKGHIKNGQTLLCVEPNLGGSFNQATEDTGQWQELAGVIDTAEFEQITFQIRAFGDGIVWIDGVGLYEILGTAEASGLPSQE
ncbi:MAG: hypothetical protein HYU36_00430 [Planctomycetes bacterium]|nr:hypothetical protein [Planctomycetota bacterium]